MDNDYLQIAANILAVWTTNDPLAIGDKGLINQTLIEKITAVARINQDRLRSTQLISLIIHLWIIDNNIKPYGD